MKTLILITALWYTQFCSAQSPRTIDATGLGEIMAAKDESIHIINFWATWCGPCVKELPYFEALSAEQRQGVKVTLVSMDLDLDPDTAKVYKFVQRKGIRSQVLLLDEPDPNSYINSVDKNWSGALPATLILNHKTGKRILIQRSLKEGELERLLDDFQ